ncbi:hypothetical protein EIP91_002220 [Steccherinum ochraceum]|uniref:Uncharacterized protein n=1 Tax=Steccherinum ochraceum TaxID=92696 RepID=A0A4R0RCN0_9APHY|nr:hypothetical protein EIP91_002220 [Steccherinum ochraceum]
MLTSFTIFAVAVVVASATNIDNCDFTTSCSPSSCEPCTDTAPDPSPIPFPYVMRPSEYADDVDFDEDRYEEAHLPDLPFEYHHPTDSSYPTDFFPWKGWFKTPEYFFPDPVLDEEAEPEEEEEPAAIPIPSHSPTPILILNSELGDRQIVTDGPQESSSAAEDIVEDGEADTRHGIVDEFNEWVRVARLSPGPYAGSYMSEVEGDDSEDAGNY